MNVKQLKEAAFEAIHLQCQSIISQCAKVASSGRMSATIEGTLLKSDYHKSYLKLSGLVVRDSWNVLGVKIPISNPVVSWSLSKEEFEELYNKFVKD